MRVSAHLYYLFVSVPLPFSRRKESLLQVATAACQRHLTLLTPASAGFLFFATRFAAVALKSELAYAMPYNRGALQARPAGSHTSITYLEAKEACISCIAGRNGMHLYICLTPCAWFRYVLRHARLQYKQNASNLQAN
jgi:succinylglutamate desuccinylase